MAAVRLGDDGAGLDVERRKQRRGAVSPIVVRSPFGLAGLHGQQGRSAVEGLNLGLLVDAQHHGMVGRVDVEADDVADLLDQQRVGRQLEGLAPVWTQPEGPPDATDGHATEAGRPCERAGAPVRGARRDRLQRGDDEDAAIVGLAFCAGLRRAEIAALVLARRLPRRPAPAGARTTGCSWAASPL